MAVSRSGRWSQFWANLKKTVVLSRQKEIFVGKDDMGNSYYEKLADEAKGLKRQRRVRAANHNEFTVPDVPVEWMTWLQGRRLDPPSEEEITTNYVNKVKTLGRAEDLAAERRTVDAERDEEKTEEVKSSYDDRGVKFPSYPEYKVNPGDEEFGRRDK